MTKVLKIESLSVLDAADSCSFPLVHLGSVPDLKTRGRKSRSAVCVLQLGYIATYLKGPNINLVFNSLHMYYCTDCISFYFAWQEEDFLLQTQRQGAYLSNQLTCGGEGKDLNSRKSSPSLQLHSTVYRCTICTVYSCTVQSTAAQYGMQLHTAVYSIILQYKVQLHSTV